MKRILRQVMPALILISISALAYGKGDAEARQWLVRMAAAMNQMSYQGTFVYVHGNSVETMRITHVVDENGIRERLYSISGPQREIIRDQDGVRCVLGDDKAVMEDAVVAGSIFPDIPLNSMNGEDNRYRFETGGRARLAGHVARRVSILPQDRYRYGYEFWLEENSGLLLKWVLYNKRREAIAHLMFTNLSVGNDVREEELISPTPPEEFVRLDSGMPARLALTSSNPRWKPTHLPPGFKLATHSVQLEHGQSVYEHQVYSDGLASVSVYIEDRAEGSTMVEGNSKIGTANAFSRTLGSKQVTVIGEVPLVTVRSIGYAVVPPDSNQ